MFKGIMGYICTYIHIYIHIGGLGSDVGEESEIDNQSICRDLGVMDLGFRVYEVGFY